MHVAGATSRNRPHHAGVPVRPRVSVYIATSLDNRIARDDGSLDWLAPVQESSGEDYGYAAFMQTVDAVVMGRATYDTIRGFDSWPFEGRRVIVLTNRRLESAFGETMHAGALAPLMDRLGREGVTRVYLDGGVTIRQGLTESLVDDMTLSIVPVVLGGGRPLFDSTVPGSDWMLLGADAFATGLVQLRYRRTTA